ncbi:MAG: hypothetical protein HQM13_14195 [SAR324 cluster bacterium]|nr:hypothetical protein [SAR324 cluster bacterium]
MKNFGTNFLSACLFLFAVFVSAMLFLDELDLAARFQSATHSFHDWEEIREPPPNITASMKMPHHFWGKCLRCHIFSDQPEENKKSPFGLFLGEVSKVKKVGATIIFDAIRPHPEAGRCIKCHNIIVPH